MSSWACGAPDSTSAMNSSAMRSASSHSPSSKLTRRKVRTCPPRQPAGPEPLGHAQVLEVQLVRTPPVAEPADDRCQIRVSTQDIEDGLDSQGELEAVLQVTHTVAVVEPTRATPRVLRAEALTASSPSVSASVEGLVGELSSRPVRRTEHLEARKRAQHQRLRLGRRNVLDERLRVRSVPFEGAAVAGLSGQIGEQDCGLGGRAPVAEPKEASARLQRTRRTRSRRYSGGRARSATGGTAARRRPPARARAPDERTSRSGRRHSTSKPDRRRRRARPGRELPAHRSQFRRRARARAR